MSEPYKIGDIITMGLQRRTFWQWLCNEKPKPQQWVVKTANNQPGGISYIEPIN